MQRSIAMQAIINSKLILPHTVLTGQTLLFGTHIYDILPAGSPLPEGTESIDAKGAYLSPGFINMHIHGCGGADTMDGTRTSMEIGNFQNAALRHFYRRQ